LLLLLIEKNQLNNQQIAELLLLISSQTGEKPMWSWIKKMFQSPIRYAVDLESVYQMAGVC